jgi:alkanesulfonate monooxygenase SsuD/methylene tetrahydromethanopterin reductase-like flavin-dependent oxidoreductase (luciferase family)
MLELTGRLADGWSVSVPYSPPETIPAMQARIDTAARRAGRNPQDIRRGYNLMGSIHLPNRPRATATRQGAILGTADEWAEMIAGYYREIGMDTFFFWPLGGYEEAQIRSFAEEVIPGARQSLGID